MPELNVHPGIVVGVNGSPASKVAVQWAARDAELRSVPLTLVHVLPPAPGGWMRSLLPPTRRRREQGRQLLDQAFEWTKQSRQPGPRHVYREMPCGFTVPALVEQSRAADMVVVGCLGTGTLR